MYTDSAFQRTRNWWKRLAAFDGDFTQSKKHAMWRSIHIAQESRITKCWCYGGTTFAALELSMRKIGKQNTVYEVKRTPADSINKLITLK